MRVLVLANTRSGRGKAARLADDLARRLREEGHVVDLTDPAAGAQHSANGRPAPDAVVSVGGDGTIFHALPGLVGAGTPVYHIPGGNENLFAREFGMTTDPTRLSRALGGLEPEAVDVGTVNGRPFALMVSIGPDAGVIHRLHASRSRANGYAAYMRPALGEALRPHLPRLSVVADGEALVAGRRGLLVVANCRQYALRLDPARGADMRDGELDVVFLPAGTTAGAIRWFARCVRGDPRDRRGAVRARGGRVTVIAEDRAPWQVDGEAGGWIGPGERLELGVMAGALRVLRA